MAALSLASAFITYVATERDSRAGNLFAIASQQWAEEQQAEQQIDAQIAQDTVLTSKLDGFYSALASNRTAADAVEASDPGRAAELRLRVQEASAQYEQLEPLFRAAAPTPEGARLVYDPGYARNVARAMDPKSFRVSSEQTRREARAAAELTTWTVQAVLVLVLSLFLLTIAHVVGRSRGTALAWCAAALSAGAVVWFAIPDVGAATPVLGLAGAVVLLLLVARIPAVRRRLSGLADSRNLTDVGAVPGPPDGMAQTDPSGPPNSRFDQFVVLTIAFATLLGAAAGYMQGLASRAAEDSAWAANDRGVQAIGALRTAEEDVAVQVDTYAEAMTQRAAAWNAQHRAAAADYTGDSASSAYWWAEAARLAALGERLAERSQLGSRLGIAGIEGMDGLDAIRAGVWVKPATLLGEQDAHNAAAANWSDRAGQNLAVLSWLAVAVYLLGLSLVFRDRTTRRLLALIGTALIALSLVRSGATLLSASPVSNTRAEAAAAAYGAGVVALQRNDPKSAVEHFTRALKERPDFGLARGERAAATLMLGSASGLGMRTGFTMDAVNRAIADLEAASARGANTATVRLNLGAMLIHRSIHTGSESDLKHSIDQSREGLKLGGDYDRDGGAYHANQILGRINLALALLAVGRPEESESEYRRIGEQIRTLPPHLQPYFVTAGTSTLDLLEKAPRPVPAETITAMKSLLAATVYQPASQSRAVVTGASAEIHASLLQWRATIDQFDTKSDSLAVHWYRLDPTIGEWGAVPVASGALEFGGVGLGGQFQSDGPNSYWGNTSAVLTTDNPPTCVRPGTYRVELYLNGQLFTAPDVDSPPQQSTYRPVISRDLGAAMCTLDGWTIRQTPGSSRAARSADGKRGLVLFRVQQPLLPGTDAREVAIDRIMARGHELPAGLILDTLTPGRPSVFGGREAVWRTYSYLGGTARTAAVNLPSGAVLVACAFGENTWASSPEAWALLQSTTTLTR